MLPWVTWSCWLCNVHHFKLYRTYVMWVNLKCLVPCVALVLIPSTSLGHSLSYNWNLLQFHWVLGVQCHQYWHVLRIESRCIAPYFSHVVLFALTCYISNQWIILYDRHGAVFTVLRWVLCITMLLMHVAQVKRVCNLFCVKCLNLAIRFSYSACFTLNVQWYTRPHVGL